MVSEAQNECIELFYELVGVNTVYGAGGFEGFAGSKSAAEAVHSDLLELGHSLRILSQHL